MPPQSPSAAAPAPASPHDLTDRLAAIVGAGHVITDEADLQPYVTEWRGYYRGRTPAVVRPGSTAEVAAIVAYANAHGVPVVPQSGNTGLVGGQVPDESGREIVLSLQRMDRIRAIDVEGGTVTAEAGVILERLHEAADEAGMLFPLTLGSQGSCRIGGNIATNAGGTQVLAYGNTRSLVLGLEVVLPSGEVWNGLRRLVKDNTGYDLKQLFIGGEGTLGIITAAVLKLVPKPRGQAVAIAGIAGPDVALALLSRARDAAGPNLTSFELMPRFGMEIVTRNVPDTRDPLADPHPWYVLLEVSSGRDEADAAAMLEHILEGGIEAGEIADAAIAASVAQARAFWHLRHAASEAQKPEGASIKHDVSVPVARVPELIARGCAAVVALIPGARPFPFGHVGDGNIHFNISQPVGADPKAFMARAGEVHAIIHGLVAELDGSISAEHGIGRYKRALLASVKDPVEMDMMRRIKAALDPNGIMSPGRVV